MVKEKAMLRTPGPTPVPPEVQTAMNQPMIGHRSAAFAELFTETSERLKPLFGTEQDVFIVSGSGTSVLEAAVVNTVSQGDEVVVVVTGAFGDRFAAICERFGAVTHRLEVPWGEACTKEMLTAYLQQYSQTKAVFATYCETSTAVINPIADLAATIREHSDALFVVDGVSCVGAVPMEMDRWGIDILVTGSQKALMLPPGLAMISVSERAWQVIERNQAPSFYLDLAAYRASYQKGMTPYTPALSLIYGLSAVLTIMDEEEMTAIVRRHELMKNMMRTACKALGLSLLVAESSASPTVTAVTSDNHVNADTLRRILQTDFHIECAGGQKQLKGTLLRVGHMGWCFPTDIFTVITYMELGLRKMNVGVELGAGVQAAEEVYLSFV